ncbi:tyrosine-protein phosphatase [Kitasatospora sp. DSM 101779]|uniref:tyrosine-protein phosphatase n=1 Tax=Kitasatospora sp. DSM 101779 TaxID=2853165 RepID=UPI0021D8E331|nr:tyrosine-protein phosphatase [Kitasatospora sp. DSM 101779]MCU7820934.1 tyrosine-protein phosphatase [Kitasatospora sp. DSM 101779]
MDSAERTGLDPAGTAVQVPGVRNFRDAGGVGGLRRGVLYRSGALHRLPPEGARRLADLGVRTVVDLRSVPEVAERPDDRRGLPVDHWHLPVFTEQRWPAEQAELYPAMAEHAGPVAASLVRRLARPGTLPVLVHCASGKDRTGVVVAVLQSLLGASEAEITADFLRSNAALGLSEETAGPGHNSRPVAAAHLRRAMLRIRSHHGSVADYLLAHGAGEEHLSAVRAALGAQEPVGGRRQDRRHADCP